MPPHDQDAGLNFDRSRPVPHAQCSRWRRSLLVSSVWPGRDVRGSVRCSTSVWFRTPRTAAAHGNRSGERCETAALTTGCAATATLPWWRPLCLPLTPMTGAPNLTRTAEERVSPEGARRMPNLPRTHVETLSHQSFPVFRVVGEPPKNSLERALSIFADVRAGEGATTVLLALNVFLLLAGYSVMKPARDGLILTEGGAELACTFFTRAGDVVSAGVVGLGQIGAMTTAAFALIVLTIVWLFVARQIAKEHRRRTL